MVGLYTAFIYEPLYNVLIFFYDVFADFGIAIVLTTLLLKFFFIPLSKKQIETQKRMQELQPKIKEIQNKYKTDKEKQTKELMAFYKENKLNPFGGCLPLIVQMLFLFAIYNIIFKIGQSNFTVDGNALYTFVNNPGSIKHLFLNFIDLTRPNLYFAVVTAVAQYYQMKMMLGKQALSQPINGENGPDIAAMMNKQMLYLLPAMILFFGATFPAALSLYWLVSTLFMILQQRYMMKTQAVGAETEKR